MRVVPHRDPLRAALGDALRQTRDERGLSQDELGLDTGVHRNYIGGVERGERQPTVSTVARLAHALGYRTSELSSGLHHAGDPLAQARRRPDTTAFCLLQEVI